MSQINNSYLFYSFSSTNHRFFSKKIYVSSPLIRTLYLSPIPPTFIDTAFFTSNTLSMQYNLSLYKIEMGFLLPYSSISNITFTYFFVIYSPNFYFQYSSFKLYNITEINATQTLHSIIFTIGLLKHLALWSECRLQIQHQTRLTDRTPSIWLEILRLRSE